MATSGVVAKQTATQAGHGLIGGIGFDRLMMILGIVFVSGIYLDGWAHSHGFVDDTFFTPWHGVLYGGYALNAIVLVTTLFLNHARRRSWLTAMPDGYVLSLVGVPLFFLGGLGDMTWHTLFGFEVGIEPLLSPAHLLLAMSATFIISGPLRSVWQRVRDEKVEGWNTLLPAILSLLALLSVFTFFTNFAHPLVRVTLMTEPYTNTNGALGTAGILLQSALLMGILLLAVRRWRLPFGAATLLFTANAALVSVFDDTYLLVSAALVAGIVVDLLLWRMQPSARRVDMLRLFAFVVPVMLYLCYFAALSLTGLGLTWSLNMWLGATVMAGVVGLLISFLIVPPSVPAKVQ